MEPESDTDDDNLEPESDMPGDGVCRQLENSSEDSEASISVMGIKRFDHKTKVKARSERRNLQTASQLCTKQVGTGEINQIIQSLLKVNVRRITKTYQIET